MNSIVRLEIVNTSRSWLTYFFVVILVLSGVFSGNKFTLTAGEGIYLNSPYSIGFMLGMLSLSIIFFAILYSTQFLFKEWDAKFDLVFFSLPFSKMTYLSGKFWFFYLKTFFSFLLLVLGFVIGQTLRSGNEIKSGFNLWHYLYPLMIFGLINSFFVCSFLFFTAYTTRKKLLVVVGGLLLYVLYMVLLVFSNSPFMSGSTPQSIEAQQISALLDPFGLSAYFFEAGVFSVQQKNSLIVPLSGWLLINRTAFFLVSILFLTIAFRLFSFSIRTGKRANKRNELETPQIPGDLDNFQTQKPDFGIVAGLKSVLSFLKTDLTYLFKSITIVAVSILLVFYLGMEMFAEIDKGIRLPEKYVSSGLMATSVSSNFHLLGLLILAYFVNDLYWRSHGSNFLLIEKSTYFSNSKLAGHILSVSILLIFLTGILILEGLIFQFSYSYTRIDCYAYWGVVVFNTFPLILFSAFLLLINDNISNRYISLGVSVVSVFVLASPFSKTIIKYPLFHIFSGYNGVFSDFNGYGIYLSAFSQRLLFGLGFIGFLWFLNDFAKTKKWNIRKSIFVSALIILSVLNGVLFMKGYVPQDKESTILEAVHYEKSFRAYENKPQPTITDVVAKVHLFPSQNAYQIEGEYVLKNQTKFPIHKVLINFSPDLTIESAVFNNSNESIAINKFVTEINLNKPLQPNEKAKLNFTLSYKWFAVNGHQSHNAIVGNGSFLRISRYFPAIGYQEDREIKDDQHRVIYDLGVASELKRLEAPEVVSRDFINLSLTLSTEKGQTAVGTGDLKRQWSANSRNYFEYSAKNIPFRFAVSSAAYRKKTIGHRGVKINIYYDENHAENVDQLIKNAIITLDYCSENFGKYPFTSINFVEVSSFTKGFAATAYPSTVFMTENKLFHANIYADKKQDVINELAGHELSHLWWGNNQIKPDDREGAAMLTETLAMYTEMMLYKKMYGKDKMMDQLKIHKQIYETQKGLDGDQPLYKVTHENIHISYSKGAIIMVELSELIGEDKVNLALRNFLKNNSYPRKPTSLDLLNEFYAVLPNEKMKTKVDSLFKTE